MTLIQAILIGIISVLGGSTPAMLGTTVGNYTLNRPLIGGTVVGIVLGDVSGVITVAIPMQVMWIALVTPGGTVASDLGAVSFIGIPLAYVGAKASGWDLAGTDAQGLATSISAMTCYRYLYVLRNSFRKLNLAALGMGSVRQRKH
jgi:PTS system mannose-specific IIC component